MVPKPFSLDIVLKIRKRKEDIAQQKLIQALSLQKQIEDKIETAHVRRQEMTNLLAVKQQEGMLAAELSLFEERIDLSNKTINSLNKLLQEKIKLVESKRSNLITKSRDHKVLQALKKKQNKTWTKYLEKKESNMLDEIAILHHTRTPL